MDIYVIRHTQTATAKGLCYGQSDVPLAPSFAEEVRQLKQKMPTLLMDCQVYSSPLQRCLRLAEQFSSNIITDARLLELNFGAWENTLFSAIEPETLRDWTENFVHTAPPGGESFIVLCQRVAAFWEALIQQPAEQVLIITHAGVIRALLAQVLQLPPANAFQLAINPGSIHKLQYLHDYTYIHALNH